MKRTRNNRRRLELRRTTVLDLTDARVVHGAVVTSCVPTCPTKRTELDTLCIPPI